LTDNGISTTKEKEENNYQSALLSYKLKSSLISQPM